MSQFDTIGVGPNSSFQAGELHDDVKAGLKRAIVDARKLIAAASRRTIPPAGRIDLSFLVLIFGLFLVARVFNC